MIIATHHHSLTLGISVIIPIQLSLSVSTAGPTIHPTNLVLTQVAVIAALCCAGHICMVGGGGGCSCMLLLYPVPTSTDAAPDFCTLCLYLCTLHPDLWTLCLSCFPFFNWCKHSTCTGGGCHQLQLTPVVLFHSATNADSPLVHVVASPYLCNLCWWCFFIQPLTQIAHLHLGNYNTKLKY